MAVRAWCRRFGTKESLRRVLDSGETRIILSVTGERPEEIFLSFPLSRVASRSHPFLFLLFACMSCADSTQLPLGPVNMEVLEDEEAKECKG